jgi:hypothetical protein
MQNIQMMKIIIVNTCSYIWVLYMRLCVFLCACMCVCVLCVVLDLFAQAGRQLSVQQSE